ncbi:VOC family protein [Flammeovirgaceae bacterium SG7u.111]|nr:VOC family protein [Flammeovirgaceae bacterium SG7u.132]WPO37715.1 VOC family protein [Flammeovirgaceae bacterium SG7u.111]
MIQLDYLDHIAIRVKDIHRSADWYEKVLGLERYEKEEWGGMPIMMFAGKSGIALFPTKTVEPKKIPEGDFYQTSHFAFNVQRSKFEEAKQHLNDNGVTFYEEDHHFFHSIYFEDLDGYRLEITTLVGDVESFFSKK